MVEIRQSNLPKHSAKQLPTVKSGFWGRKNFPNSAKGLQDAIAAWKDLMRAVLDDKLKTIDSPGVNIFKQGEMATKYKDIVLLEVWEDELYIKPDPEAVELVKTKKNRRKLFRGEIDIDNKKLQKTLSDKKDSMAKKGDEK